EGDDEHVRDAHARRQRAYVVAAGGARQAPGEPGVVERAEKHHQPERRQDAAEHDGVGHLEHEAQERRQRQHVDEDVGAEAEERVPVAGRPNGRTMGGGGHGFLPDETVSADKKADAPFTIPMPGTSSRERDVRPYTRGFEDESRPREADRDIAVSATWRSPSVLANSMPSPAPTARRPAHWPETVERPRKSAAAADP